MERKLKNKVLIVGLGIGELYRECCIELGYEIYTIDVDIRKSPDTTSIHSQISSDFDLVIICTPNYLHYVNALQLMNKCKNILIEKPGLNNIEQLNDLYRLHKNVYIVKNNLYRDRDYICDKEYSFVKLKWFTKNRIPYPGGWFTNKQLSYGGVSRDILPHLLHLLSCIEKDVIGILPHYYKSKQNYNLNDIDDTEYGVVKKDGIYNVEDYLKIDFYIKEICYSIEINWKSNEEDDISIEYFDYYGKSIDKKILGLCPKEAYREMIYDILERKSPIVTKENHINLDIWLHQILNLF